MGYQVGSVCYFDKETAEKVYFSGVSPVIRQDGVLLQLEYKNSSWNLAGQVVGSNLPSCDPMENFKDGQFIGWSVFLVMLVCYMFHLFRTRLR